MKPKTKKKAKSALNAFLPTRPSREELLSRHILTAKNTPEISAESAPDVETVKKCVDYLNSIEGMEMILSEEEVKLNGNFKDTR